MTFCKIRMYMIHFILNYSMDTKLVLNLLSRRNRLSKPLGHVVKLCGLWTEKQNKDRVELRWPVCLCDLWLMLICLTRPPTWRMRVTVLLFSLLLLCPPLSHTWWVPGPHLLSAGWSLQRDTLATVSFSVFTVTLSYLLKTMVTTWTWSKLTPRSMSPCWKGKRFLNTQTSRERCMIAQPRIRRNPC